MAAHTMLLCPFVDASTQGLLLFELMDVIAGLLYHKKTLAV